MNQTQALFKVSKVGNVRVMEAGSLQEFDNSDLEPVLEHLIDTCTWPALEPETLALGWGCSSAERSGLGHRHEQLSHAIQPQTQKELSRVLRTELLMPTTKPDGTCSRT